MIPGKIGRHDKLYQLNHHLGYFPSGGEKKTVAMRKKGPDGSHDTNGA